MSSVDTDARTATPSADETELLARLRAGDEQAFDALIGRYHGMMLAVARGYVGAAAVAEEVVQEAWLGVLKGLDGFEGRSSLKTWILRIVVNIALTRGSREARSVPFSALAGDDDDPAVEPRRFRGADDGFPGHWAGYPANWSARPEAAVLGRETLAVVKRAIAELPEAQRIVIALRDIQGLSADEVCEALAISPGNQRVLLHRGRSRVRRALERHLDG